MKFLFSFFLLCFILQFSSAFANKVHVPPGCYATKCFSKMWKSQCKRGETRFSAAPCNFATRRDICCPNSVQFPPTVS